MRLHYRNEVPQSTIEDKFSKSGVNTEQMLLHFHHPQRKLQKGNVFPSVRQEFCPGGGMHGGGGGRWLCVHGGGMCGRGACMDRGECVEVGMCGRGACMVGVCV